MTDNSALYAYLNDTLSRWYRPLLSQKITILDFGCGNGFLTDCIQNSFFNAHIIGVDSNVQQIEENKKSYPHRDFRVVNNAKMLFSNDSIDLIYAVNVFHHIDKKDRKNYAQELLRILKPSSSLVIIESNPLNFSARTEFYKEHPQEISMLSAQILKRLFYNGHIHVSVKYLYPYISSNLEFLLKSIPFGPLYTVIIQK